MRTKYPPIECFRSGFLEVGSGHRIYWEESGNPNGIPIVFLHGGPGSGTEPGHRCFFNPQIYRIVLLDQRGCGKSQPHSSLKDNTTWHLVADIEKLRSHLKIEKWVVFGGSWGSTLSLAYAETHPDRVLALILRGIFLGRKKELHWFYQFGAHHIFPDEWEKYLDPIPPSERADLISAYYRALTSSDLATRRRAAQAWAGWEGATLKLFFTPINFSNSPKTITPTPSPASNAITSSTTASSIQTIGLSKTSLKSAIFPPSSSKDATTSFARWKAPGSFTKPGPKRNLKSSKTQATPPANPASPTL